MNGPSEEEAAAYAAPWLWCRSDLFEDPPSLAWWVRESCTGGLWHLLSFVESIFRKWEKLISKTTCKLNILSSYLFIYFFFETDSHVAQATLELTLPQNDLGLLILLTPPPSAGMRITSRYAWFKPHWRGGMRHLHARQINSFPTEQHYPPIGWICFYFDIKSSCYCSQWY